MTLHCKPPTTQTSLTIMCLQTSTIFYISLTILPQNTPLQLQSCRLGQYSTTPSKKYIKGPQPLLQSRIYFQYNTSWEVNFQVTLHVQSMEGPEDFNGESITIIEIFHRWPLSQRGLLEWKVWNCQTAIR